MKPYLMKTSSGRVLCGDCRADVTSGPAAHLPGCPTGGTLSGLPVCPSQPACQSEGTHITHGSAAVGCPCRALPCAYCGSLMMGGRRITRLKDGRVAHIECHTKQERDRCE